MQLGSSNHSDVILMRKCSKVKVFWKVFKVLSTLKFYQLEMGKWKEGEIESEETASVLFTNMIMEVALFFAYQVRVKKKKGSLENVITFESRKQFYARVGQLLASFDLCRNIDGIFTSLKF